MIKKIERFQFESKEYLPVVVVVVVVVVVLNFISWLNAINTAVIAANTKTKANKMRYL